ncbi:Hpt domain-containing protein, partial [Xanthomonas translucens]
SAVVAPPLAPSWDLAPVADAPIAASMPPPLPSQTPQAPQWTLHEDAAVMANAEAAERIDAAADPSAAAVSAAGNEAAFVVVSPPISFDPVAAEQEEGSALAEPLQITTDTLALEGDAFRTMHAAAASATDEAAPANYGFDPVAAEYAERDAAAGHDDPSLGIVDAQAAAPTDTAHDDVLVMELEDAPAFADTASDEVHTIVWNDTPATLADDNDNDNDNDNDFAAEPNTPTIDLSSSDTVFVAEPEGEPGQAPHAHAGEAEHADVDAGAEHSPFVDLTWPEPTPAPEARVPGVHQASIQPIALDPASAAFLAELDAAASQFDVAAAPAVADAPSATDAGEDVEAPAPVVTIDRGFVDDGGDIDADIREVFLEEFDEELVNLGNLLPAWRAAPNQLESLRPIRRVFHTLKGSGRLVGARVLGEFSWKIESMLNRVLDGTRAASPAVVTMVELAYEVLPQLNAALRGHGVIHADLDAIQAVADRVAAGEDAYYFAAAPAVAGAAPRAGTPASVDSVLREILEAEVGTHLETVRDWLQHAPQPATEALLRAVHTMSGAFAMTDVPEITEVTGPAESYVKRLLAAAVVPGADGVRALDDAAQAIAATIEELQAPSPVIPPFTALAQRLQALVATLPDLQWSALAHDEDEEDHAERSHAQADAALDPQLLQAVELTAADDLSAYLGDVRHLDAAGADAEHADATHVAENADADASAAQASDAPDGSAAAFDAEHASVGANLAQDDDAAEQASAPVAPPADSDSASAAIDPDTQALLAQDGKLDELTVDAPLADEGAPADSELPPPAEEPLAAQQQDAPAVAGATHGEPHQDGDQEASQRDAHDQDEHDQNEQDQARDSHGYAFNAEPVPPSTQWQGSEPASANDDAELLPVADDAAVHADTAPHAHDDAEAAAQSQHDAVDHYGDTHAGQTDIETHPADAEAIDATDATEVADATDAHDHVPTPHAEDGAHSESESADADADADAALGATADFEQTHSTHTADAPAHNAWHEGAAGSDPAPVEAPSAHATPADETQASDIADIAPDNAEHPSDSAHPADTDATQPAHAQTDAPADTTSGDAQHAPADVADAPSFAESAPHDTASADSIELAAVDLGPLDFADLDRELVDIFVEEGKDLLDHCDRLVAELRAAPQDRDALAGLQRDLHTLKGGARMAGVNPIGDLGHGIESLLEAVAANRTELDRRDVQLLERGFDRLHQLLTLTGNHRAVAMPD